MSNTLRAERSTYTLRLAHTPHNVNLTVRLIYQLTMCCEQSRFHWRIYSPLRGSSPSSWRLILCFQITTDFLGVPFLAASSGAAIVVVAPTAHDSSSSKPPRLQSTHSCTITPYHRQTQLNLPIPSHPSTQFSLRTPINLPVLPKSLDQLACSKLTYMRWSAKL